MNDWKSQLKSDATEWLLEESHPSVRYFTFKWLLDKLEDDPEVIAAQAAIAGSDSVAKLLRGQKPEGYWGSDARPHHGTQGNLLILNWLGYRGNGEVRRAMDYRIEGCLQEDGAYGIELKGRMVKLPCHATELLRLMMVNGYQEDRRARKLLSWLIKIQEEDGAWPCVSKLVPFSCSWATADVLKAFDFLPEDWISDRVKASRRKIVELFLEAGIYRYGKGKPSPRWLEFGYPLRFDSDLLDVLEHLAPHISPDEERIQEALQIVLDKQDAEGRWPCEKEPKGGRWMKKFFDFEPIGEPSKWVTLHAMNMLKRLYAN